jgi:pimeloyl-ACP methyl ester carboxylesterase
MAADHVVRKLSAVLAADIAGYSRPMGADEEDTLASLNGHLREHVEPCIARNRGRIVKTIGDALLGEFASVVDAVRWIDPALRVSNLKEPIPLRRPDDFARYAEGLRLAGLPEGDRLPPELWTNRNRSHLEVTMADTDPVRAATTVFHVVSADGSRIAYERFGSGPAIVFVGGALNDRNGRASGVPLAKLMQPGFTVYAYDGRGRGGSSATPPYSVEREIEDLRALVDAAGGSAALFGMSSGCALVLAAAAAGVRATRIALYDPPFSTDSAAEVRAKVYDARLQELVGAGDDNAALTLFLTTIGMPSQMIEGMRNGPAWQPLSRLAPTLVHDSAVLNSREGAPVPVARIGKIEAPILVIAGEASPPALRQSAEAVAAAAREGSYQVLSGQTHDVAIDVLAPVLIDFFFNRALL